jgi:flagellar protein FlaF
MSKPPRYKDFRTSSSRYDAQNSRLETSPLSQRRNEAQALLTAARHLQNLHKNWDQLGYQELEQALRLNRQIWFLFYEQAVQAQNSNEARPTATRTDIIELAHFVFKRTLDILASPQQDKLSVLIHVNKEIATGLVERKKFMPSEGNS